MPFLESGAGGHPDDDVRARVRRRAARRDTLVLLVLVAALIAAVLFGATRLA